VSLVSATGPRESRVASGRRRDWPRRPAGAGHRAADGAGGVSLVYAPEAGGNSWSPAAGGGIGRGDRPVQGIERLAELAA